MKVLENYQQNVFISVPFKNFELPNHPPVIHRRLTLLQVLPLFVPRITEKRKLIRLWYIPKSIFSGNFGKFPIFFFFFLTGVSGLQYLMRFLIRNIQICRLPFSPLRVFKTPQLMSTVKYLFLRSMR